MVPVIVLILLFLIVPFLKHIMLVLSCSLNPKLLNFLVPYFKYDIPPLMFPIYVLDLYLYDVRVYKSNTKKYEIQEKTLFSNISLGNTHMFFSGRTTKFCLPPPHRLSGPCHFSSLFLSLRISWNGFWQFFSLKLLGWIFSIYRWKRIEDDICVIISNKPIIYTNHIYVFQI